MALDPYIPLTDLRWVVRISLLDYTTTFAACAGMIAARVIRLHRSRRASQNLQLLDPLWPLAYYWPVYVWALQALDSFTTHMFTGLHGGTKDALVAYTVWGSDIVYASGLSLAYVSISCGVTQVLINRSRSPSSGWRAAIPFSAAIAVTNVFFVNSAILLAIVVDAQTAPNNAVQPTGSAPSSGTSCSQSPLRAAGG